MTTATRNGKHFNSLVVFKVEDELFCVPRRKLETASPVFRNMFAFPGTSTGVEGSTEADPIVLEGYLKQDFENLLDVIDPPDGLWSPQSPLLDALTKEQLVSVLKLSTTWEMGAVRAFAIERLEGMALSSMEKISLARTYRVEPWFKEAISELTTCIETPALDDMKDLGWETVARIMWLRETQGGKLVPAVHFRAPGEELCFDVPWSAVQCYDNDHQWSGCPTCGTTTQPDVVLTVEQQGNYGISAEKKVVTKDTLLKINDAIQDCFASELKALSA